MLYITRNRVKESVKSEHLSEVNKLVDILYNSRRWEGCYVK